MKGTFTSRAQAPRLMIISQLVCDSPSLSVLFFSTGCRNSSASRSDIAEDDAGTFSVEVNTLLIWAQADFLYFDGVAEQLIALDQHRSCPQYPSNSISWSPLRATPSLKPSCPAAISRSAEGMRELKPSCAIAWSINLSQYLDIFLHFANPTGRYARDLPFPDIALP
ncbi:hypothetical protein Hypma_003327 [Hypsizygus marmoreus]|uniref:Uncharacterized protein n=1 Tax=Hypsizygus marmoreus TaxID=39966 RepID=A0A369J2D9_HYPMA|nr:hypothetical protein Hypma_003327 [Hypsizygus marmoreus]